jgi:hypothetical protein
LLSFVVEINQFLGEAFKLFTFKCGHGFMPLSASCARISKDAGHVNQMTLAVMISDMIPTIANRGGDGYSNFNQGNG